MERGLRRFPEETQMPMPPAAAETVREVPIPEPAASPTVQVVCGPLTEGVAVAGMTVADVRALLARPFNIAPRAVALVNGQPVTSRRRLAAGETLEFVRAGGEKGAH